MQLLAAFLVQKLSRIDSRMGRKWYEVYIFSRFFSPQLDWDLLDAQRTTERKILQKDLLLLIAQQQ